MAVTSFGRFLKYYVETYEEPVVSEEGRVARPTEFDDPLQLHPLPNLGFVAPINVRNKKDQLHNDLVDFFVSHNAVLTEDEINVNGKRLL